jgi:NitT/TauT family transport system permease protein
MSDAARTVQDAENTLTPIVRAPDTERAGVEQRGSAGSSGRRRRWTRLGRKLAIVLVMFVVWEVLTRLLDVNPLLFPPFSAVAASFFERLADGRLLGYAWTTISMLFIAQVLATLLAFALAALAVMTRIGRDLLDTVTAMFNPLPAIALLPLAIIWFGLNVRSLIFVTANAALWPMAVSFLMGLTTTPKTILAVARNLGLRRAKLVVEVLLPSALPHLITGLKVGWAFGWRTVVAAELVFGTTGGGAGLGWYINQSRFSLNTAEVMVAIVAVIIIGLATEALFTTLERRTIRRWGMVEGAR